MRWTISAFVICGAIASGLGAIEVHTSPSVDIVIITLKWAAIALCASGVLCFVASVGCGAPGEQPTPSPSRNSDP